MVQAAETALRDAIGQSELDHMLKDRAGHQQADAGPALRRVDEMGLPLRLCRDQGSRHPLADERAIAGQAKRSAKNAPASSVPKASRRLRTSSPKPPMIHRRGAGALELSRLQTLAEIGVEHNSTIIAMLPVQPAHAVQTIGSALGIPGKLEP